MPPQCSGRSLGRSMLANQPACRYPPSFQERPRCSVAEASNPDRSGLRASVRLRIANALSTQDLETSPRPSDRVPRPHADQERQENDQPKTPCRPAGAGRVGRSPRPRPTAATAECPSRRNTSVSRVTSLLRMKPAIREACSQVQAGPRGGAWPRKGAPVHVVARIGRPESARANTPIRAVGGSCWVIMELRGDRRKSYE